jgi:hypothetical protein
MRNILLLTRGKAPFLLFLAILLTACDIGGPQPISSTGKTFPTITLIPSITPIPTVTPIPDQPTDTPNANIDSILSPQGDSPIANTGAATTTGTDQQIPGSPQPTELLPPSPTSTPTSPPLPVGRLPGKLLGLLPSRQGLWVMYPDGTRATLLTHDPILDLAISPSGWVAAYITNPDPQNFSYNQPFGYTLKIVTLYNDRIFTVTSLDPQGISASSPSDVLDSAYQSINAYNHGAMAWSPDSSTLAFTSSHEASSDRPASSNIYLYNLNNASLNRFTNLQLPQGPAHPFRLVWSPFGNRLYFTAAYAFGTGSGYYLAGAWVNGLDGSSVQVATGVNSSGENLLAWLNHNLVLLSSSTSACGNQNIRKVNLSTGEVLPLWPNCYQVAQYDRLRDQILVSINPKQANSGGESAPGLYLISVSQAQVKPISKHSFERLLSGGPVGQDSAAWYGYNHGEGLFTIQRSGEIHPLFTGAPFDGSTGVAIQPLFRLPNADWLWSGDGLYLCRPGYPPQQITASPVDNLTASPSVIGLYFYLAQEKDNKRIYGIRARDWQPFILDPRITDPMAIDWTG